MQTISSGGPKDADSADIDRVITYRWRFAMPNVHASAHPHPALESARPCKTSSCALLPVVIRHMQSGQFPIDRWPS